MFALLTPLLSQAQQERERVTYLLLVELRLQSFRHQGFSGTDDIVETQLRHASIGDVVGLIRDAILPQQFVNNVRVRDMKSLAPGKPKSGR